MKLHSRMFAWLLSCAAIATSAACSSDNESLGAADSTASSIPRSTFVCQQKLNFKALRTDVKRHISIDALPVTLRDSVMTQGANSFIAPLTETDFVATGIEPTLIAKGTSAFIIVSEAVIPQVVNPGLVSLPPDAPPLTAPDYNYEVQVFDGKSGRALFTEYTTLPDSCVTP